jgi:3-hydroxyisobutyrate dehydrogenase-like beta-hydroxyacid dehydrogenase
MQVAFLGLGAMGREMVPHIASAGHDVTVYNRTRDRAQGLPEAVRVADSPDVAVSEAEVVVTMLADDQAVEALVFGSTDATGQAVPGALAAMKVGAVHLSMSTISPALSRRLTESHRAAAQAFVAAPVFGRPDFARAQRLWVVAAGEPEDIERCRPVFASFSAGVSIVGREGWQANIVKLAGNFTIAAMLETLGEAFALVRKSGVDAGLFLDTINKALFRSPIYEGYGTLIAEERFVPPGFKLDLGLKDVRLALEAAGAAKVPMPLASLVRDHLLSASAQGDGDVDWAALGRVAADRAGLVRKG